MNKNHVFAALTIIGLVTIIFSSIVYYSDLNKESCSNTIESTVKHWSCALIINKNNSLSQSWEWIYNNYNFIMINSLIIGFLFGVMTFLYVLKEEE